MTQDQSYRPLYVVIEQIKNLPELNALLVFDNEQEATDYASVERDPDITVQLIPVRTMSLRIWLESVQQR